MYPSSRRTFLTLAGAGAATVGLATVAATSAEAEPAVAAAAAPTRLPAGAAGAVVAHVDDVRAGTVTVMVAGRHVQVHDPELVARLARVAATIPTA